MPELLILPNADAAKYYTTTVLNGDNAGVDLYVPTKVMFEAGEKKLVSMGVRAAVVDGDTYKNYRQMQGIFGNDANCSEVKATERSEGDLNFSSLHYWMLPRSSISKTGLMMLNSVGVIDKTYRGELMAFLWNTTSAPVVIEAGNRLVQIVAGDMSDITQITVMDSLPTSSRGEGGFGSTGI
jgi:dUTPase